jgi:hypothetical protein
MSMPSAGGERFMGDVNGFDVFGDVVVCADDDQQHLRVLSGLCRFAVASEHHVCSAGCHVTFDKYLEHECVILARVTSELPRAAERVGRATADLRTCLTQVTAASPFALKGAPEQIARDTCMDMLTCARERTRTVSSITHYMGRALAALATSPISPPSQPEGAYVQTLWDRLTRIKSSSSTGRVEDLPLSEQGSVRRVHRAHKEFIAHLTNVFGNEVHAFVGAVADLAGWRTYAPCMLMVKRLHSDISRDLQMVATAIQNDELLKDCLTSHWGRDLRRIVTELNAPFNTGVPDIPPSDEALREVALDRAYTTLRLAERVMIEQRMYSVTKTFLAARTAREGRSAAQVVLAHIKPASQMRALESIGAAAIEIVSAVACNRAITRVFKNWANASNLTETLLAHRIARTHVILTRLWEGLHASPDTLHEAIKSAVGTKFGHSAVMSAASAFVYIRTTFDKLQIAMTNRSTGALQPYCAIWPEHVLRWFGDYKKRPDTCLPDLVWDLFVARVITTYHVKGG